MMWNNWRLSYTSGDKVNDTVTLEKNLAASKDFKLNLPHDPAILLIGICKRNETYNYAKI